MIYLNKIFKIPSPKDLKMSDNNYAMASEFFRNNSTEFTWEQYYAKVKKDYPIRYFFAATFIQFFIDIWNGFSKPIEDFIYKVKCHTLSKYKYHLIDIRQPLPKNGVVNIDAYRYGWMDTDGRMQLAMIKLLNDFVEKEMTSKHYYKPSEEEIAKLKMEGETDKNKKIEYELLRHQLDNQKEVMTIYNYWNEEHKISDKHIEEQMMIWSDRRSEVIKSSCDKCNDIILKAHHDRLNYLEQTRSEKEEEMLIRLIKIRKFLWT